jgi:TPR repeat protein
MHYNRSLIFNTMVLLLGSSAATTQEVEYILDPSIVYRTRDFLYAQDKKAFFTDFQKPFKNAKQMVEAYTEEPQELPQEPQQFVLKRVLSGKDGRERIEKPDQWPYMVIGQVDLYFSMTQGSGSGVLIGPHHFLTAAHNVFWYPDKEHKQKKEWVQRFIARLALNDSHMPFGEVRGTRIYTFKEWTEREDPAYDIALVVLNRSIGGDTGWGGLICLDSSEITQQTIHITGYPYHAAGQEVKSKQMWTMADCIKKVAGDRAFYNIDTSKGQSGGPIWINQYGNPYILGVHTQYDEAERMNSGVLLSIAKFKTIISDWIHKTGAFSEIPDRTIENWKRNAKDGSKLALQQLQNAAEQGYTKSLTALGDIYAHGEGAEKDVQKALQFYNQALDQGSAKAQFKIGKLYEEEQELAKNKDDILGSYRKAAKSGYPKAQVKVGSLYETGYIGGKQAKPNTSKAKSYYLKAAEQKYKPAYYSLGFLYERKKHETKAATWYKKAAKEKKGAKSYALAQYILGWMYVEGQGVRKDKAKAIKWYKAAATQEYAAAQYMLAFMYEGGYGIKQNSKKSAELYHKAAMQGYNSEKLIADLNARGTAMAHYMIGQIYAKGYGVKKDKVEAIKWYKEAAANQGYAPAKYKLGLYEEAANQGYAPAQYKLGEIYARGQLPGETSSETASRWQKHSIFRPKSTNPMQAALEAAEFHRKAFLYKQRQKDMAIKWYKTAAEQGYTRAQFKLGNMLLSINRNEEALRWIRLAANQGDIVAQHTLGDIYNKGNYGVEQNPQEALKWLSLAADQREAHT